ncbi:ROK family protein [Echinicola vietnamensis]|uniref:Transcriptional regulator/sugar kinase n=1 Tax=Echinicola vietnamensis (strain DSM 17526 / LMG 23754 / KMM 6221) TaxID=926556 RepID=L0G5K9_ECHVK|nr:ROK family protein [Echinicola vietnamensis]AGA80120.1 transcriptional regulator/sugar kinase [Echinicola vietnamensis DSM 17526]
MDKNKVVGVDIGGSHITTGLVDIDTNVLDEASLVRREVDSSGSAAAIIEEWKTAIEAIPGYSVQHLKIGIAMPGPFDYPNGISLIEQQGKYTSLYGLEVKKMLAEALGCDETSIHFENDAACFLQGEVASGAARSFDHAIGLTLGTGLGSSRYHGHFAEDAALWCSPFQGSIVEEFVSTRWFVEAYQKKTGKAITEVRELTLKEENKAYAADIFEEFGENLARFLIDFIQKESPEVIVLGGNITKAEELFLPKVKEELEHAGLSTPIRITELGEQAALIGAACSWKVQKENGSAGSNGQ